MRALSKRQAMNCEQAITPVCKCRCGGALHGAKRGGLSQSGEPINYGFFEALPADDPHHLMTDQERKAAALEARLRKLVRSLQ